MSVVIPARDEAARIGPCLAGLAGDPDVHEVIVVDDGSRDATADVARAARRAGRGGDGAGAGWVGKPWALQQGLEAATGEIVVSLDADTRPRPGLVGALAGALDDADLVTAGARFVCDGPGSGCCTRRCSPRSSTATARRTPRRRVAPGRVLANGQVPPCGARRCWPRAATRAAAGHMTDDAALARALARAGWRVAFVDGDGARRGADVRVGARDLARVGAVDRAART